jgi:putative ABC transport system permease protein
VFFIHHSAFCIHRSKEENMPDWKPEIRKRLAGLKLALAREAEIVEELAQHLEDRYQELLAGGVSEEEAHCAALAELSESEILARELRRVERQIGSEPVILGTRRRSNMIGDLWQDVRYSVRMLMKNPGFTAVAMLTLALGIGANTAIFSVVNSVLLRPLPFREPGRLVMVWHNNTKEGKLDDPVAHPTFLDLRAQSKRLEDAAGLTPLWRFAVPTPEGPEQVDGHWVSASYFQLLGVQPLKGRAFTADEDRPGGAPAVMVSYRLWQGHFGGDPNILSRTVPLNDSAAPIVGVLPPGFRFLDDVDLWAPLGQNPFLPRGRIVRLVRVVGRLAPGVSLQQAQAEMESIARRLEREYPDTNTGLGARVVALDEQIVGDIRPALLVLLAGVGFVLLIACVNVAGLLVARAAAREKEIAVRLSLGASRARLVRQFLTESVLLALLGGAGGLLCALWALRLLRRLSPADLPRIEEISMDGTVLVFTLLVSVLTGLVFGLLPAWWLSRSNLQESLKEGGRTTATGGTSRVRNVLAVAEVALALVLLAGAGLMVRSFAQLMQVNPGFRPDHVLTMQLGLPPSYSSQPAQRVAFYREMFARLEALPGVRAAGGVTRLPLGPGVTAKLEIEGRPVSAGEQPEIEFRRASTHYFQAMGIPLRAGRLFTERDTADALPVVVITEGAARRFWPGVDPIGKRVRFLGPQAAWFTIVGVIADVKHFGLDADARPELYTHFDQNPPVGPVLAIRTSGDPTSLAAAARRELRRLEKELLISNVKPMTDVVSESVAERRFHTLLLGGFAAVALALAAIGIYGVLSYAVAQRTHEIGIRMALGAQRGDVFRLVVGQGMLLAVLGVGIGVVGALGVTRFLKSLLFGVTPMDPLTFAGAAVFLAGVALAACYVPARRAMRIDPMVALRYE